MRLHFHAREVGEGGVVGAQDRPGGSPRSSGDDQIVRPTRPPLVSDMNEQLGVNLCYRAVVVDDGDHSQDVFKKGEAGRSLLSRGQEHTDSELRRGDGGDSDLVVITDSIVEVDCRTFRVDQEGCVKQEPGQGRSSISTTDRTSATSFDH